MGNYAKRDARQRETIERLRRWEVAKKIDGLAPGSYESFGVWLFCTWCGNGKIADSEWFFNRAKVCDDPMAQLAARVHCRRCRAKGVKAILAPTAIRSLPINFMSREGASLLLSDVPVIVE